MDWWVLGLLLGLVALGTVDGYPNEDLVLRLPGQPKVDFRQFAGYVDVDKKSGRSLFYYFAEADGDAENKPLTLWLNGGPGCSSIGGGAFTELGPFFPRGDGRSLRRNPRSWNKVSNLLFVESPAGVGWSYSNTSSDYTCGDSSTANDMLEFLMGWYEKFHEFKSRDLFLTGESYADFQESYRFFWSNGMISDELGLSIMSHGDFDHLVFTDFIFSDPHNVTHECYEAIDDADQMVSHYVSRCNVILDLCYTSIVEQEFRLQKFATKMSIGVDVCMTREIDFYFNLPEVQHALHANQTNLQYKWVHCTDLLNYNQSNGNTIMVPFLKRIIQHGIPVWIYSGDQDSVIPVTGSRRIIRELAHDLNFKITVPYGVWFHKGQVGRWATEYGNLLTFATVRGAGHMVPYAQPGRALLLFKSFISGKRLPNTTHPSIY